MEDHLTEDERAVVALRFGLKDGDTRTVRGCGEELGISRAGTSHKSRPVAGGGCWPGVGGWPGVRGWPGGRSRGALRRGAWGWLGAGGH